MGLRSASTDTATDRHGPEDVERSVTVGGDRTLEMKVAQYVYTGPRPSSVYMGNSMGWGDRSGETKAGTAGNPLF